MKPPVFGLLVPNKLFPIVILLACVAPALAQSKSYESPDKRLRAVVIPTRAQDHKIYESRVEIRTSGARLLRYRSFASPDHEHGEGVVHGEWSADGLFFVFDTSSSGGHQPWHFPTYFYSRGADRFYSLDDFVGSITSDYKLEGRSTVATSRLIGKDAESRPVRVRLGSLRLKGVSAAPGRAAHAARE